MRVAASGRGARCRDAAEGWRREGLALPAALAAVALWWLVWIGRSPLLFDEAYYWDWSRRLDLGYVDHPPLVALLIRATTFFGDGEAAVRAGMVLCGVGLAALAFWAGRLVGGRAAGWRCLLLAGSCPLFGLLFSFAGPDAPLLLCWAGAVCALLRAVEGGSARWWGAAGVLTGLAIEAKYVAVLLMPSAALFLILSRQGWRCRRGPYLAAACALAVWLPNLWWNARHDWISIRFQVSHGACVGAARSADYPVQAWLYAQNQVTLLGPLLAVLVVSGTVAALRDGLRGKTGGRRSTGEASPPPVAEGAGRDRLLLLACCTLVIAAVFFVVHGVRHWAAPGYFSGIVCAGIYLPPLVERLCGHRGPLVPAAVVAAVCLAGLAEWAGLQAAYITRSAGGSGRLVGVATAVDAALVRPVARWRDVARLVDGVLMTLPGGRRGATVVADGYGTAAELAYYLPGQPRVLNGSNQYALWPPEPVEGTVVFVRDTALVPDGPGLPPGGRLVGSLAVRDGGAVVGRVSVWLYSGGTAERALPALLAWPAALPPRCQ